MRRPAVGLNLSAGVLVGWLFFSGAVVGYTRYQHLPQPTWLRDASPIVFVVAGVGTAAFMGMIMTAWLRLAFHRGPAVRDLPSPLEGPGPPADASDTDR